MIVREDGEHLWLIAQSDHAALAAELMRAWRADGLVERATRPATLMATTLHDIGWAEFDASPSVDASSGRPIDFINAPVPVKQAVWLEALDVLPARSTYVAALVAQHALTIYRRFRLEEQWRAFFARMEYHRDHWFATDVRPDGGSGGLLDPPAGQRLTFLQDYATLSTGDLLSLTFCNGWGERHMAEGYEIVLSNQQLCVAPDPFGGQRVPFEVRARRIPNRRYVDDHDLRRTWRDAPDGLLAGVAVGLVDPSGGEPTGDHPSAGRAAGA
jgi:hypothetical protein